MEHQPFPLDLVRTQTGWTATYAALAAASATGASTVVLRRRLMRLSTRLYWHPYWAATGAAGWPELRAAVASGRGKTVVP
ncbi:hypothetical protein ACGF1Z_26695 [Streptomyces sp. NPDC048018]|uniref:hypothetical protein n=1 Tax=Streptomyces sp. NPDC048018 TaxID=3365499 RepID=UPI003721FFB0